MRSAEGMTRGPLVAALLAFLAGCGGGGGGGSAGTPPAEVPAPAPVLAPAPLAAKDMPAATLAVGGAHAVMLRADGSGVVWGIDPYGAHGTGTLLTDPTVQTLARATPVAGIAVAALARRTFVLGADGIVRGWNAPVRPSVASPSGLEPEPAVDWTFPDRIVAIATAAGVALALRDDGTVWVNPGRSSASGTRLDAVQVAGLGPVAALSSATGSRGQAVVVAQDGTVWRLVPGSTGPAIANVTAARVPDVVGARAATCSEDHCLAILNDRTVRAWGRNVEGQLGDGSTAPRASAVAVTGLADVVAVAASRAGSHAATADGRVWSWGLAFALGSGTFSRGPPPTYLGEPVPKPAPWPSAIRELVSDGETLLGRHADGGVWGHGPNSASLRGDAPLTPLAGPVRLGGLPLR